MQDLWICLICGHVGCGRGTAKHAVDHWKETGHCYSLELESQRVSPIRLLSACYMCVHAMWYMSSEPWYTSKQCWLWLVGVISQLYFQGTRNHDTSGLACLLHPVMSVRELKADAQPAHMLCSCLRYHWPILQSCRCVVLCSQVSSMLHLLLMRQTHATKLKDST